MKIIGLDVGEKRIGVARADSSTRIAVPIGYIDVNGSEWQEIARMAKVQGTNFFVIGLPRSNEGNETAQSIYVRNFAKALVEKIPEARIRFQDESLTSVVAEERLKSRRKVYGKGEIDAEAAAIILQDFLENLKRPATTEAVKTGSKTEVKETSAMTTATPTAKPAEIKNPETESTNENPDMPKKEHKIGKAGKVIAGVVIALAVAGVATWGVFKYREYQAEERARYFAELEAQMEPEVFEFTVRPGETIYEIKANLIEVGYSAEEVEAAFNADYDFSFLQGRPAGATLEGYLYGETHEFYKSTTVKEILETYLKGMQQMITDNSLEAQYAAQGLSLFEGITLASVVQMEAPTTEMPTVAQVFLSRLAAGIPLGSDVTVSYALDTVDPGRETYTDNAAALTIDSCYNTRLHAGLPCGPISNPGEAALLAVANPTDTAYLYFLTGDDGMMYYSYTEAEHNQNAYSHCQDLCNTSL